MAEFIFIHGKNPDLSLAEMVCWLEARSVRFSIVEHSDTCAVVEMQALPADMAESLGGNIKIAEVVFSSENKDAQDIADDMEKKLNFDSLFRGLPDKPYFGISSYRPGKEQEFFTSFFRRQMRGQGMKPMSVNAAKGGSVISHTDVVRKHLVGRNIELLVAGGRKFYLGKTVFVHNPYEFQKRDIGRPCQRTIFSISPRLCRIMINMSGAKSGILLDPFCGIGAVLQEAALMGLDIRGEDIDAKCIADCIENLSWLESQYKIKIGNLTGKIRTGDARKLGNYFNRDSIDAIATEPYLGPALKSGPKPGKAGKIMSEVMPLYEKAMESMLAVLKPGGRIAIVSPCFRFGNKIMQLDVEKMCNRHGAKLIDPLGKYNVEHEFPFLDFEERHRTLREINVIEKPKG